MVHKQDGYSIASLCQLLDLPRSSYARPLAGSVSDLDGTGAALTDHVPVIHNSDQGVQYAAAGYVDLLKQRCVLPPIVLTPCIPSFRVGIELNAPQSGATSASHPKGGGVR